MKGNYMLGMGRLHYQIVAHSFTSGNMLTRFTETFKCRNYYRLQSKNISDSLDISGFHNRA